MKEIAAKETAAGNRERLLTLRWGSISVQLTVWGRQRADNGPLACVTLRGAVRRIAVPRAKAPARSWLWLATKTNSIAVGACFSPF